MGSEDTITEQATSDQTSTPDSEKEANRLADRYINRAQNANELLKSRYDILETQAQRLAILQLGLVGVFVILLSGLSLSGNLNIQSIGDIYQFGSNSVSFILLYIYVLLVFGLVALVQITVTTLSLGGKLPIIFRKYIIPLGGSSISRNKESNKIGNEIANDLLKQRQRLNEFPDAQDRLLAEADRIEETQDKVIEAKKRLRLAYSILTIIFILIFLPSTVPFF
jgi:hypothetical protein